MLKNQFKKKSLWIDIVLCSHFRKQQNRVKGPVVGLKKTKCHALWTNGN